MATCSAALERVFAFMKSNPLELVPGFFALSKRPKARALSTACVWVWREGFSFTHSDLSGLL
jgi:hypothetical protein